MQFLFIGIALLGLTYFMFRKRRIDLFSLAFVSSCVYFLPGFFGYALHPSDLGAMQVSLVTETYWVMVFVLGSILLGGVTFDARLAGKAPRFTLPGGRLAPVMAISLALFGLGMMILTTGWALLDMDKGAMMAELNRWHVLFVVAMALAAVWAFTLERKLLLLFSLILLSCDVFIGFRATFAITGVTLFLLYLSAQGSQRAFPQHWRIGLIGCIAALLVFNYKYISAFIKAGLWDVVIERLSDPSFYLVTILASEPFGTQAILNEVVIRDFHVGFGHFMGLAYQFMIFAPQLGGEAVSFNDLFQPALFPGLDWRMANNIWAEMWSSGGWLLLILFAGVFNVLLGVGSYLLRLRDPVLRAWFALLGAYWAFYIHRNDISFQIVLEKRVFLIGIVCILVSVVLCSAGYKKTRKNQLLQAHSRGGE